MVVVDTDVLVTLPSTGALWWGRTIARLTEAEIRSGATALQHQCREKRERSHTTQDCSKPDERLAHRDPGVNPRDGRAQPFERAERQPPEQRTPSAGARRPARSHGKITTAA
jgi:hypothetical protein